MARTHIFPDGVIADVAIAGGQIHVVYGPKPWFWRVFDLAGELISTETQPIGYMPRTSGVVALAHDGTQFIRWTRAAPVMFVAPVPVEQVGVPVGNNPTGVSTTGREYFQRASGVFTSDGVRVADYKPTGIWESYPDSVKMMDDCNRTEPWASGYVYHAPTSGLVVAEGASGVVGRANNIPFELWEGEETRWPRCATDGTHAAVVCWSGKPNVKVWIGTLAELMDSGSVDPLLEARVAAIIASLRNVREALAGI